MSQVQESKTSQTIYFSKSNLEPNEEMVDLLAEIGKIVREIIETLSRLLSPQLSSWSTSRSSPTFSSSFTTRTTIPIPPEVITPHTTEQKLASVALHLSQIKQATKALTRDLTTQNSKPALPSSEIERMKWLIDEAIEIEAEAKRLDQISAPPTPEPLDLTRVDLRSNGEKISEKERLDRLSAQLTISDLTSNELTELCEEVSQLQNSRNSEFDTVLLASKIMKLTKLLLDEKIIDTYQYPTFHKWLFATKQMIAARKEMVELELQLLDCIQELYDLPRPLTSEQTVSLTAAKAAQTSVHLLSRQAEEGLEFAVKRLKELAKILPSPN